MHLHLTNYEEVRPLVREFSALMKSPWRAEPRSFQGVLHGLFVFTCLAVYFRPIAELPALEVAGRKYIARRLREIGTEISGLEVAVLVAGLTTRGGALANQWWRLAGEASS